MERNRSVETDAMTANPGRLTPRLCSVA